MFDPNGALREIDTQRRTVGKIEGKIDPEEIKFLLEWAGQRLLALRVSKVRPESYRSFWPDYPNDQHTAYGYTGLRLRLPSPSKDEIPLMDEILDLVLLVPIEVQRRVLNCRLLVAPLNNRYLFSWSRIALLIRSNRQNVKNIHKKGLDVISGKVDTKRMGRFRSLGLTQKLD